MTDTLNHAERALLGQMLQEEKACSAASALQPSDFALDSHRRIFTRMMNLFRSGESVDLVSLITELKRTGDLDAIGGPAYLTDLEDGSVRGNTVAAWVKIIRRESSRRRLVNLCTMTIAQAEDGSEPQDLYSSLSALASGAQVASSIARPVPISEWVLPTLQEMEQERACSQRVLGITTGLDDLDEVTTGWRPGELTYVGAIPGRGKSAFLLQSLYAAASGGVPCGLISLEMRSTQLMRRLAVLHSRLSARKMRDPRLQTTEEWNTTKSALFGLAELPVQGNDVSGLRPAQIVSLARQMHEAGAKVIFLDFVQIVHEDGKDRREAINRVSAALRDTCKQLNIPFVVASQLARRDADENRKPTMMDLRESGNLEQDAHRVILLYRPKEKASGDWTGEDEIIIAKAREGATGYINVQYDGAALLFRSRESGSNVVAFSGRRA